MIPDILGSFWQIAVVPAAYLIASRSGRYRGAFAISILAFLFPFMAFTNLHIVHDYYQMANAIFVLMAIAIALGRMFDRSHTKLALTVTAVIIFSQLSHFRVNYWHRAFETNENDQIVSAAQWVRDNSVRDSAMVAFGVDYSSVAHYYAERRGIAFPAWAPADTLVTAVDDLSGNLGGLSMGGIVDCRGMGKPNRRYPEAAELRFNEVVRRFRSQPNVVEKAFGRCVSLVMQKSGVL